MNHARAALLFCLALLIAACQAAPNPAAVATERAEWLWWSAFADRASGAVLQQTDLDLAATDLDAWGRRLTAAEAAAGTAKTGTQQIEELVRVYGLAAVQMYLVPVMQAQAPELFALLDKNTDGHLSMDEILAVDHLDPVFAVVVLATADRLRRRR